MKKMLFWKGRGTKNVLEDFLEEMSGEFSVVRFPFEYDKGSFPLFPDSEWNRWLYDNPCDVWCGISLGASLMYAASSACNRIIPTSMILINPFISRSQLSLEKNFSISDQWELELRDKPLKITKCSVVLSVHDEKIGIHHGIELAGQISASEKDLILLESDHCLSDTKIQIDLANLLKGSESSYDSIHQYRYIHKRNRNT